jgi:hypothetical protein
MLRWYAAGLVAAIALAWLAAMVHASGRAPVGLTSIAIGTMLGAILPAIAATLRVAGRKRLIAGATLLSLVTVLAQHAWLYRDFRRQWHKAWVDSPQVAMFRPEAPWSPAEYFTRELTIQNALLWTIDAALITASAVGTVYLLKRERQ